MHDLCYWSVGDGRYAAMLETMVRSCRNVGVREDFHAFSDRQIPGTTTHRLGPIDKRHYLFKIELLKRLESLHYRYFAFLDADNFFVRAPPPLLDLMQLSPIHSALESDCTDAGAKRADWWGCPLPRYVSLMRERGVQSERVYNVNAGFFIVHRDAIRTVCGLVASFWEHSRAAGYLFTEEAPLAYATHMLCGDPDRHQMRNFFDVWSCDWTGNFDNRLPNGEAWTFRDYMTDEPHLVNPAVVHAMRSKQALVRAAASGGRAAGAGPRPRPGIGVSGRHS